MRFVAAALVIACGSACGATVRSARLHDDEPVSGAELDAAGRHSRHACPAGVGVLIPGLSQLLCGEPGEGATLLALAVAEGTTTIVVGTQADEGFDHPGALYPVVGLQDVWLYGLADAHLDARLAQRARFTPVDGLADLAAAPFSWDVLRRPVVWGTLLGTLAAGIVVSGLVDESFDDQFGDDANLFGRTFTAPVGYPLAGAAFGALFMHAAISEETFFRGVLQSDWSRSLGETGGWIAASLVFGLAHAPNAWLLPEEDRTAYLAIGVPFITVLGSTLGLVYRHEGYSLLPSTAIHFWYDFLLSATFFAMDPQNSPLSASVTLPW